MLWFLTVLKGIFSTQEMILGALEDGGVLQILAILRGNMMINKWNCVYPIARQTHLES